ncbi:MAG: serine/threonine-protein kinase [Myxococcota bacterium]
MTDVNRTMEGDSAALAELAPQDEHALEELRSATLDGDPRKEHQRARVQAALFGGPTPPPETIARYRILGEIGSGAMGEVLEAYDDVLTRKVAIKLVHRQRRSPRASTRMLQEARSLAQLSHPNVVQVYEAGMHGDRAWIAMEHIDGQSLTEWLGAKPRDASVILDVFIAAGRGLAAAHEAGFVHRDFKPDNVLIDTRGRVKVVDFGLVRAIPDSHLLETLEGDSTFNGANSSSTLHPHPLTQDGTVLGTPGYMSPEQIRGAALDARSDQFSFCAAAWFALFGERPFKGATLRHLHYAMHQGTVEAGTQQPRGVGAARRVLRRGLSFKPDERFASMDELLEQLSVRSRRGWVLGAGAVALAGTLAVASVGEEPPCGEGLDPDAAWSSEHAASITDTFARTPAPYAAVTAQRVTEGMKRYAAEIGRARDTVCADRSRSDTATVDARLACLEGRSSALGALASRFDAADATTVEHAVDAVTHLPPIRRCITRGSGDEPLVPADPDLRAALASAHAARGTGHGALAVELSSALLQSATEAGDEATAVDARVLRATARFEQGEHDAAVTDMTAAIARATAAGLEERATEAWVDLATHGARDLRRPTETARWLVHAEGWVERTGLEDQRWALELARGHHQFLGAPADAYATFDALAEDLEGRAELEQLAARARHGRSMAAMQLRDTEAAARDSRWLLDYTRHKYGEQHPFTASSHYGLGLALFHGGNEEGVEHYRAALETWQAVYPSGHPETIKALVALADAELSAGRLPQARQYAEDALQMQQEVGPEELGVAEVSTVLGVVQHAEGHFDLAARSHRTALARYEKRLGPDDYNTAVARSNLGEALVMDGRYEEARPLFESALASLPPVVGDEHPVLAFPLKGAGIAAVLAGEPEEAILQLARARALAKDADPAERAEIDLAYAHALAASGDAVQSAARRAEVQAWRTSATELGLTRLDRLQRRLSASAPAESDG